MLATHFSGEMQERYASAQGPRALTFLFFGLACLIQGESSTAALSVPFQANDAGKSGSVQEISNNAHKPVRLEARALITDDTGILSCDAGALEVGVPYIVDLTLANGRSEPFEFGMLVGSCSCMHLKVKEGVIPPGGVSKIEVELKVGASKLEPELDTMLSFFRSPVDGNPILMLKLLTSIKGNLYIDQRTRTIGLSRGVSEHFFPVAISSPVVAENLVVEKSGSFADMAIELKQTEQGFGLQCLVNSEMIGDGYLNGTITVRDSTSNKSHSLNLLLEKKPPFRLAAGILYFRRPPPPSEGGEANRPGKTCQANALVSVDASWFKKDGKQGQATAAPAIESTSARLGDHPLVVRLRSLPNGVYRIEIEAADELLDQYAEQEIELALQAGDHGRVFSLPWKRFDK